VEVVARDDQDLLQHFIKIKRRQYRLAGVVKNGDFLHVAAGFYPAPAKVAEVSKVTAEMEGLERLALMQPGFPSAASRNRFEDSENYQAEPEINRQTRVNVTRHVPRA
jgi:hypothetical protein